MKNINRRNYTRKNYDYKASNGEIFHVEYRIDFSFGTMLQASANWYCERDNGEKGIKGEKSYGAYDFPRCEIEIAVRYNIAEQIEKEIGGGINLSENGFFVDGDLGVEELFKDEYFTDCFDEFETYDEYGGEEDIKPTDLDRIVISKKIEIYHAPELSIAEIINRLEYIVEQYEEDNLAIVDVMPLGDIDLMYADYLQRMWTEIYDSLCEQGFKDEAEKLDGYIYESQSNESADIYINDFIPAVKKLIIKLREVL